MLGGDDEAGGVGRTRAWRVELTTRSMPDTTVITTATHRAVSATHGVPAVGGKSAAATAKYWIVAFHLPRRRAGIEMPRRAAIER